jgi:hypothetical protein
MGGLTKPSKGPFLCTSSRYTWDYLHNFHSWTTKLLPTTYRDNEAWPILQLLTFIVAFLVCRWELVIKDCTQFTIQTKNTFNKLMLHHYPNTFTRSLRVWFNMKKKKTIKCIYSLMERFCIYLYLAWLLKNLWKEMLELFLFPRSLSTYNMHVLISFLSVKYLWYMYL